MNDVINKTFLPIHKKIQKLCTDKDSLLIAIDGRCASGKTTLAAYLKETFNCNVIPMDHFFLQPHMRTKQRLAQPGGNVDYERFLTEVLLPLRKGEFFSYRPYNCHKQQLDDAIEITPASITVIEGSYSLHPTLQEYYDYRIFLTTTYENQLQRIAFRNGENALPAFIEKWIPLEEMYFKEMDTPARCNFVITT